MTAEEFQEVRRFVRELPSKRILLSDAQLLDQCQVHLQKLVEELTSEFEYHPTIDEESVKEAQEEWKKPAEVELMKEPPHQTHHRKTATKKHH